MAGLDELEQHKKELELRRDIRRLERSERLSEVVPKWNWLWVAPLSLVGVVIIVASNWICGPRPRFACARLVEGQWQEIADRRERPKEGKKG